MKSRREMVNKLSKNFGYLMILFAILATGCNDDGDITAPGITTPDWSGVKIYSRDNYNTNLDNGDYELLRGSVRNLNDLGGPCQGDWNNCISSIELSDGWMAVLYERDGFDGDSLRVITSIKDLGDWPQGSIGDWNDKASSIRVIRP